MRSCLIAFCTALLALPLWAGPDARAPVLVELYTSQGCSSCPPADAFLRELAARDDVIALALHVDYWDYLFDDVFGKPEHTKRQYGYAEAGGRRMVYTPQMIIDGSDEVVGNRPQDVNALIARHLDEAPTVALDLRREDGRLSIAARALADVEGPLDVQLARIIPQQDVAIGHGENAGHTYSYVNIVTDLQKVGQWDPSEPLAMQAPIDGDAPVAVILQRPDHGRVEAAAMAR